MTSQHLSRHAVLASITAIICVAVALSVHAAYSDQSSDQDIRDSCKDFSVDADGVLSATCNTWKMDGTVTGTYSDTIDLDDKIGWDGHHLQRNSSDYSDECYDESIVIYTTNIYLHVTCKNERPDDTYPIETTEQIRIDDLVSNRGSRPKQ